MNRSILIVDDDPSVRASLSRALEDEAIEVRTADSGETALSSSDPLPDLVLADLRMPGMDGIELLQAMRKRDPSTDVIIMTAHDDLPTVATAMREGARDFLIKPLDLHQLRRLVGRVLEDRDTRSRIRKTAGSARDSKDRTLIGRDHRLIEVFKVIGRIADTRATVVIRGESGTGKELIAREIHRGSAYADQPFMAVDCTSVPATLLESELFGHLRGAFTGATRDRQGRFAMAGNGTIFLDEIGDTTPEFQSKLLRVLQEHEFYPVGADRPSRTGARVIAATHRNLEEMVASGTFREDLYYRLRVVEISVPPLRERMGDLDDLVEHFLRKASKAVERPLPALAPGSMDTLRRYSWPGNVRELENCITCAVAVASGDLIQASDLTLTPRVTNDADLPLAEVERLHVARVLEATGGHKARSARILEISRPRLDRLIEKHDLGMLVTKADADEIANP